MRIRILPILFLCGAAYAEDPTPTLTPVPIQMAPKHIVPAMDPAQDAAFRTTLDKNLPLSPIQIQQLRKLYDLTQKAAFVTPDAPPTPVSSSMIVNLGPGQTPPVIRLSAGFVSSLVFIDTTGSPWPIAAYGIGNPETFNIQWDQTSNTLFVQSLKSYAHGNIAVRLKDLDTPIMLSVVTGQREVDYRVDLQVQSRGPNAVAPIVTTKQAAEIRPQLINFLDGIPPESSVKLQMTAGYGEAWLSNGRLYVRTQHALLSPAWVSTVSSPDGTRVYELEPTSLLLVSQEGKAIPVKVGGL